MGDAHQVGAPSVNVALLYVLIQVVSVSVQPGIAWSERPLLDVMEVLMGPAGAALIAAGAAFTIIGNTSSVMLTAPRMVYAMGSKGMLPAWFGKVNVRWATLGSRTAPGPRPGPPRRRPGEHARDDLESARKRHEGRLRELEAALRGQLAKI